MSHTIKKLPKSEMVMMDDGCLYKLKSMGFDFDEVYVNRLNPFSSRRWRKHIKNISRLRCVSGSLFVSIYSADIDKSTDYTLSQDSNEYLQIEAGWWFTFSSGSEGAVFINLSTGLHDPNEIVRADTVEMIAQLEIRG